MPETIRAVRDSWLYVLRDTPGACSLKLWCWPLACKLPKIFELWGGCLSLPIKL